MHQVDRKKSEALLGGMAAHFRGGFTFYLTRKPRNPSPLNPIKTLYFDRRMVAVRCAER